MSLRRNVSRALSLPPRAAIKKAAGKLSEEYRILRGRRRDLGSATYSKRPYEGATRLYSYIKTPPPQMLRTHAGQVSALAGHFLAHRFDLLGSGWVQVRHAMKCGGVEGYRYDAGPPVIPDAEGRWLKGLINNANLKESRRIWRMVDEGYVPVDWQLDFKSGHRWSEKTWYKDVSYGDKSGADVKVPWELARMQHLPQLAWAYALSEEDAGGPGVSGGYQREFRNQVLDFIATNPPRFGVNWCCTMDVGIRAANWLVGYDLFRAYGARFDDGFEAVFKQSVHEHGVHIINNLEWSRELTSNHYLADITGLLFVAAYLPRTPETDAWLAFAVQGLVEEVGCQFNPDGTNFEASTCYHRLSSELVVYATALVLGLPKDKLDALQEYDYRLIKGRPRLKKAPTTLHPLGGAAGPVSPFPRWYFERLEKMAEFTVHITKPDGHIPQIGDNDSGRLFKFMPVCRRLAAADAKSRYANLHGYDGLPDNAEYLDEDHLDHRHLVAALNGLFKRADFDAFSGAGAVETEMASLLSGGAGIPSCVTDDGLTAAEKARVGLDEGAELLKERMDGLPEGQRRVLEIDAPGGDLRKGLRLYAYPDFGLYVYRSERLYLAIRCGPVGQKGNGGHAHNDQLSVELSVDGKDWITDPGTYLYTPLPERRNQYRSVRAHFAPQVTGREPGRLDMGLFKLGDHASASCLYFGEDEFIGRHVGYGGPVHRSVRIKADGISVMDCGRDLEALDYGETTARGGGLKVSPGYGSLLC